MTPFYAVNIVDNQIKAITEVKNKTHEEVKKLINKYNDDNTSKGIYKLLESEMELMLAKYQYDKTTHIIQNANNFILELEYLESSISSLKNEIERARKKVDEN